jgi:hypothetical protein
MDNADAEELPLLWPWTVTWLGGTTVMVLVEVEVVVGRSALMGLASAHAQLRWLRPDDLLVPLPTLAPSAAESQ